MSPAREVCQAVVNSCHQVENRILIIDDSPAIHDDIKKVLAVGRRSVELEAIADALFDDGAAGKTQRNEVTFEIDSALQGREGLTLVQNAVQNGRPYQVAFVDIRMPPGWNGIQTVSHIWQIDPYIQIILCTAYSDHTWDDIVAQLGSSDGLLILKKPFDTIEVRQTTHALIKKWHLHKELSGRVDSLESAVARRTQELQEINTQLQQEIEERRQIEERFKYLASHDDVTGLPNRVMLRDRAGHALARARRRGQHVVFLMTDLDHFKEINDNYGHDIGDVVLKHVADRLIEAVRECDTVARLGGDEFMIVLDEVNNPASADHVARRVLQCLEQPVEFDRKSLRVTPSIGISTFPLDAAEFEGLVKSADTAMYAAKRAGRGTYRFFSEDLRRRVAKEAEIKEELSLAIEREEFLLHYQPLIALKTGDVVAMEALVRWNHPVRGLISPIEFLAAAETAGVIVALGTWIIRSACRQNKIWQDSGLPCVPVMVNLSAIQFHDNNLVTTVVNALSEADLDSSYLQLEVTESAVMSDLDRGQQTIVRLHDLGVKVLIDDFGSGYASLNNMRNMPIHGLKLEGSLTQKIIEDPCEASMVTAITALSHALDLEVVAEGVETSEQLEQLRKMVWSLPSEVGCDKAQGHFIAKPMAADVAAEHLKKDNAMRSCQ